MSDDFISVLDLIPIGITILDRELRIRYFNSYLEGMTLFSRDEASGLYYDFVLRTNLAEEIQEHLSKNPQPEIKELEGDLINKDRHKVHIRLSLHPITIDSNTFFMLIIQDISYLHRKGVFFDRSQVSERIVTQDSRMIEILEMLPIISMSDSTILITGETGTGKDLLAEEIHRLSKRCDKPFIKINCGAIPESLLESELFGHAKGAFTGATSENPGFFRRADGGTIFLTEIGDLPLPLQVKLLTFLDDRCFYPLGSAKSVSVDVRIIAATHKNLAQLVAQKVFREDLFFRLNVLKVELPPLRDRGDDIILLANHFLKMFSEKLQKKISGFTDQVVNILKSYEYPGNVRELRNIIEYATTVTKNEVIHLNCLPQYILDIYSRKINITSDKDEYKTNNKELQETTSIQYNVSQQKWRDIEKNMILDALRTSKGNKTEAAKILGWARSTLWRKIRLYEI